MAGLSICANPPIKLSQGDWLIQYNHTSTLRVRTDGGEQIIQLHPQDSFVLQESDALKFLAMIQLRYPTLLEFFNIVWR